MMTKSRIFLIVLLSFIVGIFFRSIIGIPIAVAIGVFIFFGAIFIVSLFRRNRIIISACLLIFALGVWRGAEAFDHTGGINVDNFASAKKISFSGKIAEEPDRRSGFALYVLESEALGRVLVKTDLYPEYFYGDELAINGKVKIPENFSDFNYRAYLAKDGIFLVSGYPEISSIKRASVQNFYSRILTVKKSFIEVINKLLLEPRASFLAALLVGARRTLPADLVNAFNATGTSHIVAISGYNISIISIMLLNILTHFFIPKRISFWIVGVSLILFTLVAGAGASVVRAAIMGGLLILAKREGRLYSITNAIVLAGAAMLFINPHLLRYDAGFQLSFLATLGLVYICPHFEKRFARLPDVLSFRSNLAATLSAQIATLPVILASFGRLSLIAPLANVLILPAIPPTMLFGFIAGGVGFISLTLGTIFIFPAWLLLGYQIGIVKMLSVFPLAAISL